MSNKLSRRKVLSTIGLSGFGLLATSPAEAGKVFASANEGEKVIFFASAAELKTSVGLKAGTMVQTGGYYSIGDGGHGAYLVRAATVDAGADGGSISLKKGLMAHLINVSAVNYKLFGAAGDKVNDDGLQIKAAHQYANAHKLPVINLSGEFWIRESNGIEIKTNTEWGHSVFHLDEKHNSREPRFKILSNAAPVNIQLDADAKASLVNQLKPGVEIIPELAPYKNSFITVADTGDMIGLRMQSTGVSRGWAREELFYVEEHGRIIGDIAWTFKGYTSLTAYPASDSYLTVNGGTFYLSGDNEGAYFENGMRIERSRTIVSNQWVGLEPGKNDIAKIQRSGFYSLSCVYDVTLENIRLLPWEKDRVGVPMVPQGTYGISGRRMMKVTFKNITAEGSPVHWGVFGTNLTKDFRIESCVLNRVDVHFHCWNFYVKDSQIGQRGLTLTGGGDLFIENTSVDTSAFISFRADYGAKWDGDIRIRNCRLIPRMNASQVSVLQFTAADFDFKYPIGYGRTVRVEDMVIDFTAQPESKAVCWLMRMSEWKENAGNVQLFFPEQLEFRNVSVRGRQQGVRLLQIFDCSKFHMPKTGSYDGVRLHPNSRIVFTNIELEKMYETTAAAADEKLHFSMNDTISKRGDSLYPEIRFVDCRDVEAYVGTGGGFIRMENCSVSRIHKTNSPFRGRFSFLGCEFQAFSENETGVFYDLDAELGVNFTDCIVYMPVNKGLPSADQLNQIGFLEINQRVRFNHLNTRLGNDITGYYKTKGIRLSAAFIAMLKSHHELEG